MSRKKKIAPDRSPYLATFRRTSRRKVETLQITQDWHWRVVRKLLSDVSWLLPHDSIAALTGAIGDYDHWAIECERFSLRNVETEWAHCQPIEVAAMRQVAAVVEKFKSHGDEGQREAAAIEKLLEAERVCSNYNTKGYKALENSRYLPVMREFISRTIGDLIPDPDQLLLDARHGPGSVFGQVKLNGTSCYQKYSNWPYDVTSHARVYAVDLIRNDPRWWGALEASYRAKLGIAPWSILNGEAFWDNTLMRCPGNRITTVPKDRLKNRSIAIEPTLNIMLQLGAEGFIRRRLKKRWGVDLNTQRKNQELARAGSIDPTMWASATIDLSMASDTVSLRLAKMLLPEQWYRYLCNIRSPNGVLPNGDKVRFSKLSSMGNGATFAIESLIFSSVIYAVMKIAGYRWERSDIAIFGDDLIFPRVFAPDVIHLLRLCGFSPNEAKSFLDGPVRESCGTDWFRAYPIRPVYLKETPGSLQNLFHAHNALWIWSEIHSIPLPSTLAYIKANVAASGGANFVGPPALERTDQYLFDEAASHMHGIVKRMNYKTPKDFLWGKLLATYKELPKMHYVNEAMRATPAFSKEVFKALFGTDAAGSVFSDGDRRSFHYETYSCRPSGVREEVSDAWLDTSMYLTG